MNVESPLDLSSLPVGCVEAMDATFALCDAINKNGITVSDLAVVCRMAIERGHDMALIELTMMSIAINLAKEKTGNGDLPS